MTIGLALAIVLDTVIQCPGKPPRRGYQMQRQLKISTLAKARQTFWIGAGIIVFAVQALVYSLTQLRK
jgi:hypothetical protein